MHLDLPGFFPTRCSSHSFIFPCFARNSQREAGLRRVCLARIRDPCPTCRPVSCPPRGFSSSSGGRRRCALAASFFRVPTSITNCLNRSVYVLRAVSGRFGICLHPVPEGPEGRAPVVLLDEIPFDVARAFSLVAGQRLKLAFQLIVDPYGQLSHDVKASAVSLERYIARCMGTSGWVLSPGLEVLARYWPSQAAPLRPPLPPPGRCVRGAHPRRTRCALSSLAGSAHCSRRLPAL